MCIAKYCGFLSPVEITNRTSYFGAEINIRSILRALLSFNVELQIRSILRTHSKKSFNVELQIRSILRTHSKNPQVETCDGFPLSGGTSTLKPNNITIMRSQPVHEPLGG